MQGTQNVKSSYVSKIIVNSEDFEMISKYQLKVIIEIRTHLDALIFN